jgi:hypothetical protein
VSVNALTAIPTPKPAQIAPIMIEKDIAKSCRGNFGWRAMRADATIKIAIDGNENAAPKQRTGQ